MLAFGCDSARRVAISKSCCWRFTTAGIMAVDASELHAFWEKAQKRDRVTGGDLFEVRDTIEKPTQRAPRT
ncbi:hypothetical protein EGM92_26540, partial [Enterobacter cloacae]